MMTTFEAVLIHRLQALKNIFVTSVLKGEYCNIYLPNYIGGKQTCEMGRSDFKVTL